MTEVAGPPGPWPLWRAILSPTAGLTPAQRLVLFVLVKWADGDGHNAYPSLTLIAASTGLHRSTVSRALAALVAQGLVTRERRGRRWEYAVNLAAVLTLDRSQTRTGRKREPVLECDINGSNLRREMVAKKNATVLYTVPYRALERRVRAKGEDAGTRSKARPASIDEVRAYLHELGESRFTAEAFYDYYEARGWRLKSGPVKDWRACVRTWRRNERGASSPTRQRSGRELAGVTAALPGRCAECHKPSALTICEECQRAVWGEVALAENAFLAAQKGRRG